MIAKHKRIGVSFKVIESGKSSFVGKVIKTDDPGWKLNQIYRHLDKKRFNLVISWENYDKFSVEISNLHNKFSYL